MIFQLKSSSEGDGYSTSGPREARSSLVETGATTSSVQGDSSITGPSEVNSGLEATGATTGPAILAKENHGGMDLDTDNNLQILGSGEMDQYIEPYNAGQNIDKEIEENS